MAIATNVNFENFDPTIIPFQDTVVDDIYCNFDFSLGVHEIFNSGSVGSAKTILAAHLAVRHCLENPGARCLLGRRALQDIRDTIFQDIAEHIEGTRVMQYVSNITWNSPRIEFTNGSEIICRSWADKNYKKFRSLKLSMAVIEELTENEADESEMVYNEIIARIGRIASVKNNLVIINTNPDSPTHWAYERFINKQINLGRVYYSRTEDNPFLPRWYIENLKKQYDPKMVRRMLYGEWIEISKEVVYYMYDRTHNYRDYVYGLDEKLPVRICFDFNIGHGKPLSSCAMQYDPDHDSFHYFDEVVIEGMRTEQSMEEWDEKGYFDGKHKIIIHGDRNGKNRDTRNNRSDYDIIKKYLSNHKNKLNFEIQVPNTNPPVRKRHNLMNGYCENSNGDRRLFIYKNAPTCDKALRLTQLKHGASYIEDDSKWEQHIGTAMGYGLCSTLQTVNQRPQGTRQL